MVAPAGTTGPCGPDSEMFIITDRPPCGPDCSPACDCGRYLEIWNDVFMQYNKQADGTYVPLAQQNVDTGMGLERTISVLTGAKSVYETDLFTGILGKIAELSGKTYGSDAGITRSMRIIADHVRTATFIIGDDHGVTPSNVDQGYVLRRLIRRAVRHGMNIDLPTGSISKIAEVIVGQYSAPYPELARHRAHILEQFDLEEDRFQRTLRQGVREFDKVISEIERVTKAVDAFEAGLDGSDGKAAAEAFASSLRPTPDNQPIIESLRAFDASKISEYRALIAKKRAQAGQIDGRAAFKLYDHLRLPD